MGRFSESEGGSLAMLRTPEEQMAVMTFITGRGRGLRLTLIVMNWLFAPNLKTIKNLVIHGGHWLLGCFHIRFWYPDLISSYSISRYWNKQLNKILTLSLPPHHQNYIILQTPHFTTGPIFHLPFTFDHSLYIHKWGTNKENQMTAVDSNLQPW